MPKTGECLPKILSRFPELREVPIAPSESGVYLLCLRGEVVYVGQGVSVAVRIAQHAFERKKTFDSAYFLPAPWSGLDLLESALITLLEPAQNGRHSNGTIHGSIARHKAASILRTYLPCEFHATPIDQMGGAK